MNEALVFLLVKVCKLLLKCVDSDRNSPLIFFL